MYKLYLIFLIDGNVVKTNELTDDIFYQYDEGEIMSIVDVTEEKIFCENIEEENGVKVMKDWKDIDIWNGKI